MPPRRYLFVTIDMVERSFTEAIAEFFRNYPDPVPDYQYLDGERGRGLLESALAEPQQTFGGRYLHRTIYHKAAALWRSVTCNHPFVDGNKRMGFICCLTFLAFNGYFITAPQDEVEETCVKIAAANPAPEVAVLARWLRKNTISVEHLARWRRIAEAKPDYLQLGIDALNRLANNADD